MFDSREVRAVADVPLRQPSGTLAECSVSEYLRVSVGGISVGGVSIFDSILRKCYINMDSKHSDSQWLLASANIGFSARGCCDDAAGVVSWAISSAGSCCLPKVLGTDGPSTK